MTSERQPFMGAATRERPIFDEHPIGPWRARVRVTPITGLYDHGGDKGFEILAEWTGPGLPDLPPVDRAVEASDQVWVRDAELGRRVARAAVDALRAPRQPELREILRRLS